MIMILKKLESLINKSYDLIIENNITSNLIRFFIKIILSSWVIAAGKKCSVKNNL